MSDGQIRANPESLATAAHQIQQASNKLNAENEDVKREMTNLMATWQGDGATAYHAYQSQWHANFAEVQQALTKLGTAVHIARGNYVATDGAIATAFNA